MNTATVGVFTYTVTAVSKDGQRGKSSISYTVVGKTASLEKAPPPALAQIEISNTSAEVKARREQWNEKCR